MPPSASAWRPASWCPSGAPKGEPHRFTDTEARLKRMGVARVAHFSHLAWVHPRGLRAALLAGPAAAGPGGARRSDRRPGPVPGRPLPGRVHPARPLAAHTSSSACSPATDPEEIYFPEGLCRPGRGEVLADAGAFDGDTCRRMLELWGEGARRIHAFEPDPASGRNFQAMDGRVRHRERIRFHPHGPGRGPGHPALPGHRSLDATSARAASKCRAAPWTRNWRTTPRTHQDGHRRGRAGRPAGRPALLRRGPALAICLYHVQDHLWAIPLPGPRRHARAPPAPALPRHRCLGTGALRRSRPMSPCRAPGPRPCPGLRRQRPGTHPRPPPGRHRRGQPACRLPGGGLRGLRHGLCRRDPGPGGLRPLLSGQLPLRGRHPHGPAGPGGPGPVPRHRRGAGPAADRTGPPPSPRWAAPPAGCWRSCAARASATCWGWTRPRRAAAPARRRHGLAVAPGTVFDPLPGGPHDVLIAVGVVEHIRDLDRAVANLAAGPEAGRPALPGGPGPGRLPPDQRSALPGIQHRAHQFLHPRQP